MPNRCNTTPFMRESVTSFPVLRRILGYTDDQQLHHHFHLMTLGIQVRSLTYGREQVQ